MKTNPLSNPRKSVTALAMSPVLYSSLPSQSRRISLDGQDLKHHSLAKRVLNGGQNALKTKNLMVLSFHVIEGRRERFFRWDQVQVARRP